MRKLILTVALLSTAEPVLAEPSNLLKCDGYGRRVPVAEQAANALLVLGTLGIFGGLFGGPEADDTAARAKAEKGVEACTAALASDDRVTGNAIRRGEVLLARAIRYIEIGKLEEAIADARAARAVELPEILRADYARSAGVAAWLVEASAEARAGRQDKAEAAALAAFDARPYGGYTANEATDLLLLSPEISPAEQVALDRYARIHPGGLTRRGTAREGAGDFAGAAADFALWNSMLETPNALTAARVAALKAVAGAKDADAALTTAQQLVDEVAAKATGSDREAQEAAALVARADELIQLARVQLALAKAATPAEATAATALLAAKSRWLAPPAIVGAVVASARAKAPGAVITIDPAKLAADARRVALERIAGPKAAEGMMILYPRFEANGARADRAKAIQPGAKTVKTEPQRAGTMQQYSISDDRAFIDTATEASLLMLARAAAAKGADRFVMIDERLAVGIAREGFTGSNVRTLVAFPTDKAWAGQEGRAVTVAELEAALAPLYVVPAPVKPPR
ncbi:hypothetical protein [Sandaracinobacteroides saxicola]|uniref:Uncharacterized protein n=1 Tax=Sandaracinobacteroides saxicola TaxID=2759707 RepID=A0A7G5ILI5_9SPHN|nr:hypothetical protein [Sandaracinobacteroides saxicola]QMW24227.1 hypothetical protein H3309_07175 [Sandaracinobacteroides saxicola]